MAFSIGDKVVVDSPAGTAPIDGEWEVVGVFRTTIGTYLQLEHGEDFVCVREAYCRTPDAPRPSDVLEGVIAWQDSGYYIDGINRLGDQYSVFGTFEGRRVRITTEVLD